MQVVQAKLDLYPFDFYNCVTAILISGSRLEVLGPKEIIKWQVLRKNGPM